MQAIHIITKEVFFNPGGRADNYDNSGLSILRDWPSYCCFPCNNGRSAGTRKDPNTLEDPSGIVCTAGRPRSYAEVPITCWMRTETAAYTDFWVYGASKLIKGS